jgi:hypothetical protein
VYITMKEQVSILLAAQESPEDQNENPAVNGPRRCTCTKRLRIDSIEDLHPGPTSQTRVMLPKAEICAVPNTYEDWQKPAFSLRSVRYMSINVDSCGSVKARHALSQFPIERPHSLFWHDILRF